LSVRSRSCRKKMNVKTLGGLTRVNEQAPLTGETLLAEIKEKMAAAGLRLCRSLERGTPLPSEKARKAGPPPACPPAPPACPTVGGGTPGAAPDISGSDSGEVLRAVESLLQRGPDMVTMGKLPQTPRAKKVIEFAVEEARGLSHSDLDTEHLLLGLLREP